MELFVVWLYGVVISLIFRSGYVDIFLSDFVQCVCSCTVFSSRYIWLDFC